MEWRELDSAGSVQGQVAGSCEKGTEVLCSVKQSLLTSRKLLDSPERLLSMALVYIVLTSIPYYPPRHQQWSRTDSYSSVTDNS